MWTVQANSQVALTVTKVGLTSGFELDLVQGLGEGYFVSGISGDMSPQLIDLGAFDKQVNDMFCENATIRMHATLGLEHIPHFDLNIGFYKIYDRFDAVSYSFNDVNNTFESLDYKSLSHEAGLDLSMLKVLPIFKFFELHGGLGAQMGYSYKSRMNVTHAKNTYETIEVDPTLTRSSERIITNSEMVMEETYRLKNGWSHKYFLQAGFAFVLIERLELGLIARYGLGHRWLGGRLYPTKLESMNFVMAYRLG